MGARGYSVTVAGRGTPPRHALYLAEAKLGLSPFEGGVRVAGVFELGARDDDVAAGGGAKLLAAASPYLAGWQPDPGRRRRGVGRACARPLRTGCR